MFTSQFKREAVELVEREGVSVAEAARRLGGWAGIGLGQRVQRAGGATVERGPLADFLRGLTEGGGDSTGARASR